MKKTAATARKCILVGACGLISVWILTSVVLLLFPKSRHRADRITILPPPKHQHDTNTTTATARSAISLRRIRGGIRKKKKQRQKQQHRIAIVIPFFGETVEAIPSYLNLFCTAAAGSASLVDFILIHNGILDSYNTEQATSIPPNVIFVNIGSTKAFAERLVRVVDGDSHTTAAAASAVTNQTSTRHLSTKSREQLIKIVTYHIHQYPYVLVEFKPAIGYIFADILEGYSHWGYSDLDMIFGDLARWITNEELTDFDIVTYGYGDQHRLYLRGQFTIHKNIPKINQIWRDCSYLSNMDERFANVLAGKSKLRVESAEGCYSAAVLKRTDIRVKYAVKAFNDIEQEDTANTHGLYLGIGGSSNRKRRRDSGNVASVIYKARGPQDGLTLLQLSPTWFQDQHNVYGSRERKPLQRYVGKREEIHPERLKTSNKCMYWVDERYQQDICISGVHSNETVFWIDGKLYKQPFENEARPGNAVSSPFFHFQEWKRYYRQAQLASVKYATEALGWVLAKEGAIPIFPRDSQSRWPSVISPLGQTNMMQWKAVDANRKLLPQSRYCLTSAPRKNPPRPVVSGCFDSVSWQDHERVEILRDAPVWKHIDVKREVTLAVTLQISARQAANTKVLDRILDIAIANVSAWQGQPCVLVVHMSGATDESISRVKSRFEAVETDATLVAMIAGEDADFVSRKALMNMASDAAPTRWVVSGLEVERGLVLSNEASSLAYRRAKIEQDVTGSLFLIPQFAIDNKNDGRINVSFNDLAEMRVTGKPVLYGPDEFEDGCDEDEDDADLNKIFRRSNKLWWRLSTQETTMSHVPNDDTTIHELALECEDMQLSFVKLLAPDKQTEAFSVDNSPILMIDSIGPEKGMRTSELAREIEEFGGKRCYNALRLAQLAAFGYNFNVLPEAFAISTRASRDAMGGHVGDDEEDEQQEEAPGSSRCDGCFMFDEKHESIIESIVIDENIRPAKAAILWENQKSTRQ